MKSLLLFVSSLLLSSIFPIAVSAQGVNDFVITSFDSSYRLTNEDPQGTLRITERIELDFSGQNQGILRAIPTTYQGENLDMEVLDVQRDGQDEQYTLYQDSGNTVIRIGVPGVFITGEHSYVVTFIVDNVISFYDDYDELYWDVNGDQWQQVFTSVRADINTDATLTGQGECYTGAFGSTEQACEYSVGEASISARTNRELQPNETLSFAIAFEKGYFTQAPWIERNFEYIVWAAVAVVQLMLLSVGYRKWRELGKDRDLGPTAPYFSRPKDVSVMLGSYVAHNRLDSKHLTAEIIDMAVKGYIKISETNDKKPKHTLTILKPFTSDMPKETLTLAKGLFSDSKTNVGDSVELESKKNKLYKLQARLQKQLDRAAVKRGYYEISPLGKDKVFQKEYGLAFVIAGLGVVPFIMVGPVTLIVSIGLFVAMIVLGNLMTRRSQNGAVLKQHMEGLKLYLDSAQKDRLAAHDAVAAPLETRGDIPVRDVRFFEKLLPFAITYGVEKTWAKAFSDVYAQPPEWYDGNWSRFSTVHLASSLASTTKVAATAFTPPASSGSSGSGGGGFSGGGGGGGGGGGW